MQTHVTLKEGRLSDMSKVYSVCITQDGMQMNMDLKAIGEPAAIDAVHAIGQCLALHCLEAIRLG